MLRELDNRNSNGLAVAMNWDDATGQVTVRVLDEYNGTVTNISVVAPLTPNQVFNHPFAYA